ncbi:SRPBCC family protein [Streptomyces sp. NPDC020801]|uniref:SRPBCC family protein n=1 Tax=unclassified Streptomyces TaxID=2593676 RepID=UPI00379F3EB9
MLGKWFPLAESGDGFLRSAPFRYVHSVDTTAPPERIWESITGDALVRWTLAFTSLRWDSSPPFGVGTVREITLLGVFTVRERFFRWDDGRRYTFSVVEASRPGLRRAAEDWIVEPVPTGSRLTWTLAVEPAGWARPLQWAGSPVINLLKRHVMRAVRVHTGS